MKFLIKCCGLMLLILITFSMTVTKEHKNLIYDNQDNQPDDYEVLYNDDEYRDRLILNRRSFATIKGNSNTIYKDDSSCSDNPLCLWCSGSICQKCKYGADFDSYNQCSCSERMFYDRTDRQCKECYPLCASCSGNGNNQCLSCIEGSELNGDSCECHEDTVYDSIKHQCLIKEEVFVMKEINTKTCKETEKLLERLNECIDNDSERTLTYSTIVVLQGINSPQYIKDGKDILEQRWNEDLNELTGAGLRSSYVIGRYLKEKYFETYNIGNKNMINSDNVEVLSHGDTSSVQSAYSIVLGLFALEMNTSRPIDNILLQRTHHIKDNHFYKNKNEIVNPLNENPEIIIPWSESLSSLPLIPIYSYLQDNNEASGLTNPNTCQGIKRLKEANRKDTAILTNLLELTNNISFVLNITNLPSNPHKKVKQMSIIVNAYLSNYHLGNRNMTINSDIMSYINQFNHLYHYSTLFPITEASNKNNEMKVESYKKAIIASFINRLKKNIERKITSEKESILELIQSYLNSSMIDTSILNNERLFSIELPHEEVFLIISELIKTLNSNMYSLKIDHSDIIMFDLYKRKINNFNLEDAVYAFSPYEKARLAFQVSNINHINQNAHLPNEVEYHIPISLPDYEYLLEALFNNPNLYTIKISVNNQIIYDDSLPNFYYTLAEYNNIPYPKDFCFPQNSSSLWIGCAILSSIAILQLIIMLGIHLFIK